MSAFAEIRFDIDPVKEVEKLKAGLRNKVLRKAINKASARVKESVISLAPTRYGFLKKSIRIRVRNYQNKTVWVGVVGPKMNYIRVKGKRTRGKLKGSAVRHRPAYIAHILERGSKHAKPRPFLAPALAATEAVYQSTLIDSVKQQVAELLSK